MICCCIDLDGFYVEGQFITREMGWCDADTKRMGCFHYTHDKSWQDLSVKDKKAVAFVQKHVIGLPFTPGPKEKDLHSQVQLKEDIVQAWMICKTYEAFRVAYKGGTQERDILQELRIPSFNLETLGCPKYNAISDIQTLDCGCHRGNVHCSMAECYKFMSWFNKPRP